MRKANFKDLKKVNIIIDKAKESLKNDGVDQWQNGTPNLPLLGQQVSRNNSYVYEKDDEVLAYAYLSPDYEPTYASVMKYMKGRSPITVHTFCVDKDMAGSGIATAFFEEIEDFARENGKDSIMIDTHEDNFRMRGLIGKMGFSYIGPIYIDDNGKIMPRLAYELIL
ncbi:GNAT family N-acetyltransferase [uncultured Anaerococcus sp.]|uniref:GNAT family N-acetyltransferase n=1 Tax=uncultured Anaerococcus sp. TaxID=293428 RepID=UPI002636F46D|nr:GNAT family N-acetyltransferase [uncultured Anaerococcus sp.]